MSKPKRSCSKTCRKILLWLFRAKWYRTSLPLAVDLAQARSGRLNPSRKRPMQETQVWCSMERSLAIHSLLLRMQMLLHKRDKVSTIPHHHPCMPSTRCRQCMRATSQMTLTSKSRHLPDATTPRSETNKKHLNQRNSSLYSRGASSSPKWPPRWAPQASTCTASTAVLPQRCWAMMPMNHTRCRLF